MKAVMISIQPQWCALIANGQKTLEVRKTAPKLPTPFKCYIYCTKVRKGWLNIATQRRLDGHIIGEFICDKIEWHGIPYPAFYAELDKRLIEESCVRYYALHRYAWHDDLAFWHISNLKIYDQPMELRKLSVPCYDEKIKDSYCANGRYCVCCKENADVDEDPCTCNDRPYGMRPVSRPPRSWCYVEEDEKANE